MPILSLHLNSLEKMPDFFETMSLPAQVANTGSRFTKVAEQILLQRALEGVPTE